MYYYIYDDFVQDKRYEKDLMRIENRLADLDIAGKIARLALFKQADELIADEVKRGVKTVIAVGNDATVFKVLDAVVDSGVIFGVIPIGSDNNVARMLGIPDGLAACDLLANRLTEKLDLGKINGYRFVTGVSFPKMKPEMVVDKSYIVTPTGPGHIQIRNLAIGDVKGNDEVADPRDGKLEMVVSVSGGLKLRRKNKFSSSVLSMKRLAFNTKEPVTVVADNRKVRGTKFRIQAEKAKLKVIVGKDRMF